VIGLASYETRLGVLSFQVLAVVANKHAPPVDGASLSVLMAFSSTLVLLLLFLDSFLADQSI
jgi:hypothetical protein